MTRGDDLRVLIVEDSESDALLLLRELQKAGFEVTHRRVETSADLATALSTETWDIVLSDYQMPQFTGLDAHKLVTGFDPDLPFIIISGTIGEEVAVDAMKAGVHDYLMKGSLKRLGPAIRRELEDAETRRQRRWGIERLRHLNLVLRAIRNVNQLIVREKEPQRLIEQACRELVETRGYQAAWIAILGRTNLPLITANAGFGEAFERLTVQLHSGVLPHCCTDALATSEVVLVANPAETCSACPLGDCISSHGSLTCRLESNGAVFGVLSVNLPSVFVGDQEETSLISEIAGDIAFALAGIETETERRRIEEALHESERHLKEAQRLGRIGHWVIDLETQRIEWSDMVYAIYGRNPTQGPPSVAEEAEYYSAGDAERLKACSTKAVNTGQPYEVDVSVCRKDGQVLSVIATGFPVTDGNGQAVRLLGTVQDITERKKAEVALAQAAVHWNSTFDAVTNPVSVISADHVFLQVNAALCATLGRSREEIVGRKCYELAHGAQAPIAGCPCLEALRTSQPGAGSIEQDGRFLHLTAWPIRDADGRISSFAHFAEDVTEARKADRERRQALCETEALLRCNRQLLDSMDFKKTARAIFDEMLALTGATSGYLALLSADGVNNDVQFLESGGRACSVDTSLPMPVRGLRAEAYKRGEAIYDNDFRGSEHWSLMPKGHVELENVLFVPLKTNGQAVGLFGLANKPGGFNERDAKSANAFAEIAAIALREEKTRTALAESEERLRLVFDSTAEYIMLLDHAHRIQFINRVEEGSTREGVIGTPLYEIADEKHRDVARRALDRAVNDRAPQTYDTVYARPGGIEVHFASVASPVIVAGEVVGTVVTSRDMTERRKMEAQLAQADRLSSMGMLAAGVAHEINNPLSYILYNLESLVDDLPRLLDAMRGYQARVTAHLGADEAEGIVGDAATAMSPVALDDIQDRFRDALAGTRRIRDIARGLGTFSRVERDQLVPVNLMYVIEAALNMCFNEIKYRARVIKDFGKTPTVMASEGRLSQVFLNLFVNAAHAIDEGNVEANEIRVRTWSEGDAVCAEVRDTGRGIAPEHLHKIFEPFFSTKKTGVGSGLGLPISKGIVEGYGGTITVQSEVGKGTAFTIRLPIRAAEIALASAAEPSEGADHVRGRILIVDDEDAIRSAVVRMLRGHETVDANSGEAARRILEKDQAFDLVLCDMMMPQYSGMDLHGWLAEHHPVLAKRLVFVTGGAFTPRAREYLAQVDNLRIEKPFDIANFKKIVADKIRLSKSRDPRET